MTSLICVLNHIKNLMFQLKWKYQFFGVKNGEKEKNRQKLEISFPSLPIK